MQDIPLFEEELDYVNENHIQAFAKALVWDELEHGHDYNDGSGTRRNSYSTRHNSTTGEEEDLEHLEQLEGEAITNLSPMKPIKISSKSDWLPVHTRMVESKHKRRTSKAKTRAKPERITNEFRNSIGYTLLRWPILFFVGTWIIFLCVIYSIVRFHVALSEYYFTWRGDRKKLRDKLRKSVNYEEWVENAMALDKYLNLDKWSENPKFSYYDYRTLEMTTKRLSSLKKENLDHELLVVLQGCLKTNFAGIENRQLYSHRYYGTKILLDKYIDVVTDCIDHIIDSKDIDLGAKRKFFKIVSKNYGKTALCLSGGACFTYTHFGVVKALLDNDLLPTIISGTSGGGLIAALACTRTNEELKKLLVPQLARKITACEDPFSVWFPRFWKTGARFDSIAWAKKAQFFTKGSMTFQEAYKRTGRKLNVSTVPADPHSPVILCNNITSPNCIIWSTLLASSAVPGILNPVVLMMKNPNNEQEIIPFSLGNKWRDGSLRTDIPVDALNTYYNVNFSIVSQVNPHISLFFYAPKGTVGRPVAISRRLTHKNQFVSFRGGFLGTAVEQLLRLEITKWLRIIKTLDLLPHLLEQDWSNIWLQRFSGTITVWPRNKLKDFWYLLSDPNEERLEEMLIKGQRSMFPRILFIRHRLNIERAIERGRKLSKLSNEVKSSEPINSSDGFEVHNVTYDDDDYSDSSDEEFAKNHTSPFDTTYIGVSDEYSSRTASPDFSPEVSPDGSPAIGPGLFRRRVSDERRHTVF